VCANATYDSTDGRWYALQNGEMFKAAELAGRIYQNALARRVIELGYDIRLTAENGKAKGFEIVGPTESDLEVQSTRSKEIEAEAQALAAERGRPLSNAERHVITTSTAGKKLKEISTDEVRALQLGKYDATAKARNYGTITRARERAKSGLAAHAPEPKTRRNLEAAIESAIEHIAERNSVFDSRAVLTQVLREHPGYGNYQTVCDLVAQREKDTIVRIESKTDDARVPQEIRPLTTAHNLRLETEIAQMVKDGEGRFGPLAANYQLEANLTSDQRAAVEMILGCPDQFVGLLGPAGTGKTTTLTSLDKVVRAIGAVVETIYVAPTHQAKGVLRRDGFTQATTVARLLTDVRSKRADLKGKLLVVDEGAMLSTADKHALNAVVRASGARCLSVGDIKQLPAVSAGDGMAIEIRHGGMKTAVLTTIFRQRENPEYLRAMEMMATGNVNASLAMLDQQGRVHETGGAYLEKAATAYCAACPAATIKGQKDPATVALVAPTWREIYAVTGFIRADRKLRGQLTGPEVGRGVVDTLGLTAAERRSDRSYRVGMMVSPAERGFGGLKKGQWYEVREVTAGKLTLSGGKQIALKADGARLQVGERRELPLQVGDRILLQGNDSAAGLENGMRGYVTKILPDGSLRFRQSVAGKLAARETAIPANYKTFTHGYAMTIHAAQGETVTHVIGAVGRAISGALWNVLASRGRRVVDLFVPDKASTTQRAPSSIEGRPAALDFISNTMNQEHPRSKTPVAKSLFEDRASDGGLTNTEPLPEPRKIEDEPPPPGDHAHKLPEPNTGAGILARVAAKQFGNAAALPEPRTRISEGNSAPLPEQRSTVPKEHMQKFSAATVAARFKVSPSMALLFRPFVTPLRDKGRSLGGQ